MLLSGTGVSGSWNGCMWELEMSLMWEEVRLPRENPLCPSWGQPYPITYNCRSRGSNSGCCGEKQEHCLLLDTVSIEPLINLFPSNHQSIHITIIFVCWRCLPQHFLKYNLVLIRTIFIILIFTVS